MLGPNDKKFRQIKAVLRSNMPQQNSKNQGVTNTTENNGWFASSQPS